ncbi:MAG: Crp/Fnr family transcriptional regulator [Campylobacteraceae bacterium]|jgi:CRP/FNR family transcriptional regulator|nr:Crp/Fnr family transcriptional regulator [Campylobacteraceae bacterium]
MIIFDKITTINSKQVKMDGFEELNSSVIFQKIDKSDLKLLHNASKIKKFNSGEIINYENDEVLKVYFLLKGFIKVYKINRFDNEIFLYTLKNEGLITTFSLFETSYYFSNTECIENSTILCIEFSKLQQLFQTSQSITLFFYEQLEKLYSLLKYVINREIVHDGTAKVAYMLANSLDEFNILKKQDVAYMLNIQPETLSRILTKLKREEIIETSMDGSVIVKNYNKLIAIFI